MKKGYFYLLLVLYFTLLAFVIMTKRDAGRSLALLEKRAAPQGVVVQAEKGPGDSFRIKFIQVFNDSAERYPEPSEKLTETAKMGFVSSHTWDGACSSDDGVSFGIRTIEYEGQLPRDPDFLFKENSFQNLPKGSLHSVVSTLNHFLAKHR